MLLDKIHPKQYCIQPNGIKKSINMNPDKSNQSSYHNMNANKRCKKCKAATCCNCCMCGYICLSLLILLSILMIIIYYAILPAFNNIYPQIENVYIKLYDYSIGEEHWKFGNRSFSKIFFNGTGEFAVEVCNPNFVGYHIHHWDIDAIAMNLYQNKEQWGNVYCCSDHPLWNESNEYIPEQYNFTFDSNQWMVSHHTINMSFVLFVTHFTEELFYIAYEASYLNDWKLNLTLHGEGWGKTWNIIDVKVLMDCDITVNASYFFPFAPSMDDSFIRSVDIANIGEIGAYDAKEYSYLKDIIGTVPPQKYMWQKFPVLDLTCSYGIGAFRYL